jgi:alkylation response protein AidB-like acyl-CoA dehydrogenase
MFLTVAQKDFHTLIREFALTHVSPVAKAIDKEARFPIELIERMRTENLLGIPYPEEFGGRNLDTLCYAMAVEELSRVCGSTGITLAAHISLGTYPIIAFGNQSQKSRYLPRLCSGDTLGAFGLTEPAAGSDAGGTLTSAVKDGQDWIINGSKMWITNAAYADYLVATAVTDREKREISCFIVEKGMSGYIIGPAEKKLGLRGSDTHALTFENLRVPDENLLGVAGEGFKQMLKTLNGGRISIGAMALGLAQGALDTVQDFCANTRMRQSLSFMLSDMATKVEASRHLVYHAARLKDAGQDYVKEGAMAKLHASETASWCADRAMQILGEAGCTDDYDVERIYRDAKLCEIGEGTSEIQRLVIARQLIGR